MTDSRECGFMGCGQPQCVDYCMPVTAPQSRESFLEEIVATLLLNEFHDLEVSEDGDGWQEPFSEVWACTCEQWTGPEWVQRDPKCSDRPKLDSVLAEWLEHVNEQAKVDY